MFGLVGVLLVLNTLFMLLMVLFCIRTFFLYILHFAGFTMHYILRCFDMFMKKFWPFEVEDICVLCCEVWIALVCVVQHVGSCAQVLQALDASI